MDMIIFGITPLERKLGGKCAHQLFPETAINHGTEMIRRVNALSAFVSSGMSVTVEIDQ